MVDKAKSLDAFVLSVKSCSITKNDVGVPRNQQNLGEPIVSDTSHPSPSTTPSGGQDSGYPGPPSALGDAPSQLTLVARLQPALSHRTGPPTFLASGSSVRVSRELLARAWAAGAGPGDEPLTIDLDSTVCETYGLGKEGAPHTGHRAISYEIMRDVLRRSHGQLDDLHIVLRNLIEAIPSPMGRRTDCAETHRSLPA